MHHFYLNRAAQDGDTESESSTVTPWLQSGAQRGQKRGSHFNGFVSLCPNCLGSIPGWALAAILLANNLVSLRGACELPYWLQLSPAVFPKAERLYHSLAFDSQRGVTVLYGGMLPGTLGGTPPTYKDVYHDTWEFDGRTWTQRFPATTPPGLIYQAMSYDTARGVTVMFGGQKGANGYPASNEVWEWDGQNWTQVTIDGLVPPVLWDHRMVYDSARGVHVVYGGFFADHSDNAYTWEYNGATRTWALRATSGPPKRSGMATAYDSWRQQTVLFGGMLYDATSFAEGYASDTWIWDGPSGNWKQLHPAHHPAGRYLHAMAFDAERGVVVLLGGRMVKEVYPNGGSERDSFETWEWNGSDWVDRTLVYAFFYPMTFHTLVYETTRHQTLFFQNVGGNISDPMTTWALTSSNGSLDVYADAATPGIALQNGSILFPYKSLKTAINCALGGATISLKAGNYAEGPLTITKQVTLQAQKGTVQIE